MKHISLLLTFLFIAIFGYAQQYEDANDAFPVCGNQSISFDEINGTGNVNDTFTSTCSLDQNRTKWLRFKVLTAGTLAFEITPNNSGDDYDFGLFGPNPDANNLPNPIRSSYAGSDSAFFPRTGLQIVPTLAEECENADGDGFVDHINVFAGEEYLILVDNYSGTQPFRLKWDGTATLDCSIVVGNLGEDQRVCVGTEVTLDGSADDAVRYEWYRDLTPNNGSDDFVLIDGATEGSYTITDNVTAIYQIVAFNSEGGSDSDEVLIEFIDTPVATPTTLTACNNGNTTVNFTLTDANGDVTTTPDVIITYHETEQQAIDGTDALSSPYNSEEKIIYARIEHQDPTDCFETTEITLEFLDTPNVQTGATLEGCAPSGSFDFDLTQLDSQVTTDAGVTITYHASQTDAENGSPTLSSPYTATQPNTTIWVRVENAEECFATVKATLNITTTPSLTLTVYELCETTVGGGTAVFDLDSYLNDLQTSNPTLTLSIHPTEAEADANTGAMSGNYTNSTSPETLWVRIVNPTSPACNGSTSFNLIVNELPIITGTPYQLEECDVNENGTPTFTLTDADTQINPSGSYIVTYHTSLTDAEADSNNINTIDATTNTTVFARVEDGDCYVTTEVELLVNPLPVANDDELSVCSPTTQGSFDLASLVDNISGSAADVTVTFHDSQANADANANPLSSPYDAQTGTIYARVTNDVTGCYKLAEVNLVVTVEPGSLTLTDYEVCETTVGGGTAVFDLDSYLNDLQTSNPTLTLSIHPTEAEADANTGAMSGNYTNSTSPETLWVRITSPTSGDCHSKSSFNLIVNELPVITGTPYQLEECDVNENGMPTFTLTDADAQINPSGSYTVTYHSSLTDAEADSNNITTIDATTNITVFARVEDGDCYVTTEVELLVNPLPVANDDELSICAQTSQGSFDLASLVDDISGSAADVTVTFHDSQANAEANANQLPSPYDAQTGTIYARVTNDVTGCYKLSEVDLIVVVAPNTTITAFNSCENANSGEATFDLEELKTLIETDTNGTATLYPTETDAENDTNEISGNYNSAGETIWAKITTSIVDCDGLREVTLIVDSAPTIETFVRSNCRLIANPNQFTFDTSNLNNSYQYSVHTTFNDADTNVSEISFPHTTSNDNTRLFVRVTNENGCHSVSTLNLEVTDFTDNLLEEIQICYGENYTLPDGRVITEAGQYTYNNITNCTNDIYTFTFQVCNPEVYCRPRMPNAFTPNGLGVNNFFQLLEPTGCSLEIKTITIFNTWGEKVYSDVGNSFSWDGTFNNEPAQQGVYLWEIDYIWTDDQGNTGEQTYSGSVHLLR